MSAKERTPRGIYQTKGGEEREEEVVFLPEKVKGGKMGEIY